MRYRAKQKPRVKIHFRREFLNYTHIHNAIDVIATCTRTVSTRDTLRVYHINMINLIGLRARQEWNCVRHKVYDMRVRSLIPLYGKVTHSIWLSNVIPVAGARRFPRETLLSTKIDSSGFLKNICYDSVSGIYISVHRCCFRNTWRVKKIWLKTAFENLSQSLEKCTE